MQSFPSTTPYFHHLYPVLQGQTVDIQTEAPFAPANSCTFPHEKPDSAWVGPVVLAGAR